MSNYTIFKDKLRWMAIGKSSNFTAIDDRLHNGELLYRCVSQRNKPLTPQDYLSQAPTTQEKDVRWDKLQKVRNQLKDQEDTFKQTQVKKLQKISF